MRAVLHKLRTIHVMKCMYKRERHFFMAEKIRMFFFIYDNYEKIIYRNRLTILDAGKCATVLEEK